MKSHIEIRFRFTDLRISLHEILRHFVRNSGPPWSFPEEKSLDYQTHHQGEAGFVERVSDEPSEHAVIAIAQDDAGRPGTFKVTNILPQKCSSLTLDQYNAVGSEFVVALKQWLKEASIQARVFAVGPKIGLNEIIPGKQARELFEAWLKTPTPMGHPSDLYVLDRFICHSFRHCRDVKAYQIEQYLVEDLNWSRQAATWVVARISAGLELLRVDRRF